MLFANTYGGDGRGGVATMRQTKTLDGHLARFTHLLLGAGSKLGDAGAEVVAAALAENPVLKELDLSGVFPHTKKPLE